MTYTNNVKIVYTQPIKNHDMCDFQDERKKSNILMTCQIPIDGHCKIFIHCWCILIKSKNIFNNFLYNNFFCNCVIDAQYSPALWVTNLRQITWLTTYTRLCWFMWFSHSIEFLTHSRLELETLRWNPNLVSAQTNTCLYITISSCLFVLQNI